MPLKLRGQIVVFAGHWFRMRCTALQHQLAVLRRSGTLSLPDIQIRTY
jgi:hypothetical protein